MEKSNANTEISQMLSPDPIFQMATGFWVSKTLMSALELQIFTKLSGYKAVNIKELQNILAMQHRPTEVFVTALLSLGLLKLTDDATFHSGNPSAPSDADFDSNDNRLYSNSELAETFLDKNKPSSYMGDFVIMLDKQMYNRWGRLIEALKTNSPVQSGSGAEGDLKSVGSVFEEAKDGQTTKAQMQMQMQMQMFTDAMYGVSVAPAKALTKVFNFSEHKKMMDIGGGSGVYAIEAAKANPNLSATVIDLEPACNVATEYINKFHLQERVETLVLDFVKQDLPKDCDVALLSHIIHFLDVEKGKALLRKIYDSLPADRKGVVLISEWLLNDEKTGPVPSALLSLTMIVEQPEGRNYSFAEVSKMLQDVGFVNIEKRQLAGPADVVIGYKITR
jgi:3-hydroxy-5-methyl-1-naphthoate 3-O-methyltransferase